MTETKKQKKRVGNRLDGLVRFYYRITKREGLCPSCGRPTWGNVNFNRDGSSYMYCYRPECGYAPDYKQVESMGLLALLERACILIADDFLRCNNNDCTCRKGFGLCSQCREAAMQLLEDVEDFKESNR